jgi:hypothetical protein
MPYDEANLTPADTTSLAWALAWTRFLLRDTSSEEMFSDTELEAVLTSTSFVDETTSPSTRHYRPHVAAGDLIESDPDRAVSESTLGASIESREPSSIARSVRRTGRWIDDTIEAEAGVRPAGGLTLRARF